MTLEESWSSCLVVVAGYEDVAPAVAGAVQQAQAEIQLSPALADFIELRFAALGPRPSEGAAAAAVHRVRDELLRPARDAPESFFGLMVVDDRPDDVESLAVACLGTFDEIGLVVRVRGLAVARLPDGVVPAVDLRVLRSAHRLADAIHEFCDEVLNEYGAGNAAGLSGDDLRRLREAGTSESLAELSVRAGPPRTAPPPPAPARRSLLPRRRSEPPEPAAPDGVTSALVLIAVVDESLQARAFRRTRALILSLDQRLGDDPASFSTAVLGLQRTRVPALRPAGEMRRRDLRRPEDAGDLAVRLAEVDIALSRFDMARPIVVFIADEPPVADGISQRLHHELAERAELVWLLLSDSVELLARALADRSTVLIDHPDVVGELVDRIRPAAVAAG